MPKYCSGAQSQFRQVGGRVTGDLLGRGPVTVGMEDEQNRPGGEQRSDLPA